MSGKLSYEMTQTARWLCEDLSPIVDCEDDRSGLALAHLVRLIGMINKVADLEERCANLEERRAADASKIADLHAQNGGTR
jgi:hypothetical protein